MDSLPDCRRCASCCFSRFDHYIELSNVDFARLTDEEQLDLTVFEDGRCYLPTRPNGACVALTVAEGQLACSIYERRPTVCRKFERGGQACHYKIGQYLPISRPMLE